MKEIECQNITDRHIKPDFLHINESEYFIILPDGKVCVGSNDGYVEKHIISPYDIILDDIQSEGTSYHFSGIKNRCGGESDFWLHCYEGDKLYKQLAIARFIYDHVKLSDIHDNIWCATDYLTEEDMGALLHFNLRLIERKD